MSQLKKFPRSPSKLRHQQRVSPVPQYSSLFHLPPPFKPYFSARKRISIETDNSDKMTEVRSGSSLSIIDVKPHFSLKKCKGIASNVAPATPSKLFLRNIECEETSSSESPLSQYQAVTAPGPALTSPLSSPLPNSSTTMPEQSRTPVPDERLASPCVTLASTPAARLASPSVTLASTPDQAVFTPAAHATPTITVKGAENRSARHRKQAIIKSLRFGTPTKHVVLEQTPTPLNALTDAISSPLKTPVKRSGPNVNRALLFSSPIRKSKGRPVFEDDGGAVCKRPRQCSPPEATVPVPVEVMNQAENSGPRDMKGCTEDFVDLTSISGADKLSASDMEVLKCLPQELLNDVQAKERRLLEDQRLGVEKARRRQQLVAGLPKLFNNVRLIFQSESRTVIACRDLTKMVLSSLPDVTDQSEVVEQLGLLVELAPEWISVNQSLTGDSIYRINKNANMRAISKALIDAK
ncbi:hypothetical protein KP509_1Z001200 [Ceratopteris richardii]|nr:hypothetical protein KP509_1Z001200 [Ceratopteris richardii]